MAGPLKNAKHEKMAISLYKGMTQRDAYAYAGYNPERGNQTANASKVSNREDVKARVQEFIEKYHGHSESEAAEVEALSAESIETLGISRVWVIKQLMIGVSLAKGAQDFKAMTVFLELIGQEIGMFATGKSAKGGATPLEDSNSKLIQALTHVASLKAIPDAPAPPSFTDKTPTFSRVAEDVRPE